MGESVTTVSTRFGEEQPKGSPKTISLFEDSPKLKSNFESGVSIIFHPLKQEIILTFRH